jgi:hypothetical protein
MAKLGLFFVAICSPLGAAHAVGMSKRAISFLTPSSTPSEVLAGAHRLKVNSSRSKGLSTAPYKGLGGEAAVVLCPCACAFTPPIFVLAPWQPEAAHDEELVQCAVNMLVCDAAGSDFQYV